MKRNSRTACLIACLLCASELFGACNRNDSSSEEDKPRFASLEGLVMAGYQGWFNTPEDGSGQGWRHYQKNKEFRPGMCTIDLWPDVSEYEKLYDTPFVFADGTTAQVFSSRDRSTTFLHFKWLHDYGIDGVFMQRFISDIRSERGVNNYNTILFNALDAAEKYDRAVCIMYDLSGMKAGEEEILFDDWRELMHTYNITSRPNDHYLHHNGKPLVAVWGVGFDDGRDYGYDEVEKIIRFLKNEGCSVMLGVPTHWRDLSTDALQDPRLHELIRQVDAVQPWFVGRFDYNSYKNYQQLIQDDILWCQQNKITYLPVLFPGFSWYNLQNGTAPLNQIPRLEGRFFWKQVHHTISSGAQSLYLAMFDEIDEGTAFFKCANEVPVGESPFLTYEGVPADRYLWLAGQAAKALRGEIPLTAIMPVQPASDK